MRYIGLPLAIHQPQRRPLLDQWRLGLRRALAEIETSVSRSVRSRSPAVRLGLQAQLAGDRPRVEHGVM